MKNRIVSLCMEKDVIVKNQGAQRNTVNAFNLEFDAPKIVNAKIVKIQISSLKNKAKLNAN